MLTQLTDYIQDICRIDTHMQKAQNKYIMEYYAFFQEWSTTALGFDYPGTVAGQAFTTAMTTVIKTFDERWYVFFGGRIAYCLEKPTEQFFDDLKNFKLKSCSNAEKVY